jgi:hypothetical protein
MGISYADAYRDIEARGSAIAAAFSRLRFGQCSPDSILITAVCCHPWLGQPKRWVKPRVMRGVIFDVSQG